jgi:16S rRNA (guanine966-N2)-methyltransferase
MRITGGKFKGRRFHPPVKKWPTRPTTDFAREALYNIMQNRITFEKIRFLDLFGGTGSHSFECISRGCQRATYVDNFKPCVAFVKNFAMELEVEPNLDIVLSDVRKFLENQTHLFDYIFAGPPYSLKWIDNLPEMILDQNRIIPSGWLVIEHNPHHDFENRPHFYEMRKYGQTRFSFFLYE